MEAISKETMRFIVEEHRRSFKNKWNSELLYWVGDLEDDRNRIEELGEIEDWEEVFTVLMRWMMEDEEKDEFVKHMYCNLNIQYRSDQMRMCKELIRKAASVYYE